mmetsp:Transcript_104133/g.277060  ORF Transcript_104133/g.277060 Transcript_104133/m.277060 type:complete len:164 (-) Transcript_104133:202-693(-)
MATPRNTTPRNTTPRAQPQLQVTPRGGAGGGAGTPRGADAGGGGTPRGQLPGAVGAAVGAAVGGGGGDAEKGGGMDMGEEESKFKLCFYACLDFLAAIMRGLVALWNGIKYVAKRIFFPLKETAITCIDCWGRWYRPYKSKRAPDSGVPSFGQGGQGVPNFQY